MKGYPKIDFRWRVKLLKKHIEGLLENLDEKSRKNEENTIDDYNKSIYVDKIRRIEEKQKEITGLIRMKEASMSYLVENCERHNRR